LEPTSTYLKSKRGLLLFAGALLLIVLVGVNPTSPQSTHLLPFELRRPGLISYAVLVVVAYLIVETVSYWSSQNDEIRNHPSHERIHFFVIWIGLLAVVSQLYSMWLSPYENLEVSPHTYDEKFQWGALHGAAILSLSIFAAFSVLFATPILRRIRVSRISEDEQSLIEILPKRKWTLNFNPLQTNGQKDLSFNTDGTIGDGRNQNEDRWRVRGNYLELLNPSGQVFSRFVFDKATESFEHTNDEDTLSLRNQKIFLRPPKRKVVRRVATWS
jgi:hypothetical protein